MTRTTHSAGGFATSSQVSEQCAGAAVERPASSHGFAAQGEFLTRSAVANASYWGSFYGTPAAGWEPFINAVAEAWDWLLHKRLIAYRPSESTLSGQAYATRRGHRLLDATNPIALLKAEERIDVDLHPRIAERVRRQFLLGEYEPAAFIAMRDVEIRLRELAGATESEIGVSLAQRYLKVGGKLADPNLDSGEQEATMALFWGALGVFKNPSGHRQVEFADPTLASEVVLLADLLLRLLDQKEPQIAHRSKLEKIQDALDRGSVE